MWTCPPPTADPLCTIGFLLPSPCSGESYLKGSQGVLPPHLRCHSSLGPPAFWPERINPCRQTQEEVMQGAGTLKLGLGGDLAEGTGIKHVAGKLEGRPCSCHRAPSLSRPRWAMAMLWEGQSAPHTEDTVSGIVS